MQKDEKEREDKAQGHVEKETERVIERRDLERPEKPKDTDEKPTKKQNQ